MASTESDERRQFEAMMAFGASQPGASQDGIGAPSSEHSEEEIDQPENDQPEHGQPEHDQPEHDQPENDQQENDQAEINRLERDIDGAINIPAQPLSGKSSVWLNGLVWLVCLLWRALCPGFGITIIVIIATLLESLWGEAGPASPLLAVKGPKDTLPLPHLVNLGLYEAVSNVTDSNWATTQSQLSVCVNTSNNGVGVVLAAALEEYSRENDDGSKSRKSALHRHIDAIDEQLVCVLSNAVDLAGIYEGAKWAYKEHFAKVAKAHGTAEPGRFLRFCISANPLSLKWIGLDLKKRYWDPWAEKAEEAKRVQEEMQTLENGRTNLYEIARVVTAIQGDLEQLADGLKNKRL